MIDIHCHLTYPGLDEKSEAVVKQSKEAGMKAVITCGYPKDVKKAIELSRKHEGFIFLTMGLHPIDIKDMTEKEVKDYWDMIRSHADEIVAVGEIGLEKKWFDDPKLLERFRQTFVDGLELAKELNKPVVLHLRKAEQEGFDIVNEMKMDQVIFHYYSGNITLAKKIIENGWFISIPTTIDRSSNLKDIGKKFPLENILTETDSPFSSPIQNQVNVPQNVRLTIERIAELRRAKFEEVDRITTENAIRVFKMNL